MTQRCILCDDPDAVYHWHDGLIRVDVFMGARDDHVVVIGPDSLTADEARELAGKLAEAAAACDRANGVVW